MSRAVRYQRFVEGKTEKRLIEELKRVGKMIRSGNVNVINVMQKKLPNHVLTNLVENTIVILVFDTDIKTTEILTENITRLKKCRGVKDIWCVMQVENLEDELIRSTDVHEIRELIGCKSNTDFKREMLREKRLMEKLKAHHFSLEKMWSIDPDNIFKQYENQGYKIKL